MLLSSVQFIRPVRISGDPSCERIDPALSRYRGYLLELVGQVVEMTSPQGQTHHVPVSNVACFTPKSTRPQHSSMPLPEEQPEEPGEPPVKRGPGRPRKVA